MADSPASKSSVVRIVALALTTLVALSLGGYGGYLALHGPGLGQASFKLFGQEFSSNSIAVAAIFMSVVLFVIVVTAIVRPKENSQKAIVSSVKVDGVRTEGNNSPAFVRGDFQAGDTSSPPSRVPSSGAMFERVEIRNATTAGENAPAVVMGNYTVHITQQIKEESKAKAKKRWKEIGMGIFPGMSLSPGIHVNFLQSMLIALNRAFHGEDFVSFIAVVSIRQTTRNGHTVSLFEIVCPYDQFPNQLQMMGRKIIEQGIGAQTLPAEERARAVADAKHEFAAELAKLTDFGIYHPNTGFSEEPTAYRCIYDRRSKRIEIRRIEPTLDVTDYENGIATTDGVLQFIAAVMVSQVVLVDIDKFTPGASTFRLLAAVIDKTLDFSNLRVNVDDPEEWDYKNNAFDQEARLTDTTG